MADIHEERPEIYYIPGNYEEAGGVLGGKIQTRNAIELLVICGPIAFLELKILHFTAQTNIIIFCVTLIPLAALCIFGIGGESLSQIALAFIRFTRNKRKLHYSDFTEASDDALGRKFSIDKFLDSIASSGWKAAFKKLKEQSELDKLAEEQSGKSSKDSKKNKKTKKKKKGNLGVKSAKKTKQPSDELSAKEALREQERAIGPQTKGWLSTAKKDRSFSDLNQGKKK